MSPPVSGGGENAACAPQHHTPPIFFPRKENGRCDRPKERRLHCKRAARRAAMPADCTAHSAALPRLKLLYDWPLLLLPAVAQPLAALLPYGCGTPLAFSWGSKGAILSRERMAPLSAHPAARREQSAEHRAAKNILPFSKEKRTPLPRRSSYFCESKIYRYFCMPSVARAGSPETEMVNLTPVALLKRSSSFRKSSAAWLHSPPVILNRLSMKMWEIS